MCMIGRADIALLYPLSSVAQRFPQKERGICLRLQTTTLREPDSQNDGCSYDVRDLSHALS